MIVLFSKIRQKTMWNRLPVLLFILFACLIGWLGKDGQFEPKPHSIEKPMDEVRSFETDLQEAGAFITDESRRDNDTRERSAAVILDSTTMQVSIGQRAKNDSGTSAFVESLD